MTISNITCIQFYLILVPLNTYFLRIHQSMPTSPNNRWNKDSYNPITKQRLKDHKVSIDNYLRLHQYAPLAISIFLLN